MKREKPDPWKTDFSPEAYSALAETFKALSDPTRTRIVHILSGGEMSVSSIAAKAGVSSSAVSHQLRVLRQMRLVKVRRDGQEMHYSLDDPHIQALFLEALEHVRDFIPSSSILEGEAP